MPGTVLSSGEYNDEPKAMEWGMMHSHNSVNACVVESKSTCSEGKEQGSTRVRNKRTLRVSCKNWNLWNVLVQLWHILL